MKKIESYTNQTVFDLAIGQMGALEGIWEILDANPSLSLDLSAPSGTLLKIPTTILNARVANFYALKNIISVSGIDEESILTENDMNTVPQILNYNLANGSKEFEKVKLDFLYDMLTVQLNYENIPSETVIAHLDQSLDGENWSPVPYSNQILDDQEQVHTWNIAYLSTQFVRLHIDCQGQATGTIKSVIWKT